MAKTKTEKPKPKRFKVTIEGGTPGSMESFNEDATEAWKKAAGAGVSDLIKVETRKPTMPYVPKEPYKTDGRPKPKGFRRTFIFSVHSNAAKAVQPDG